MKDGRFYIDQYSSEEKGVVSATEESNHAAGPEEPENGLVHASGDTDKYMTEKRTSNLRFWVALSLVVTFCVIAILRTIAGIVKSDPTIFERVLLPLGFVVGIVVGYLFPK